MRDGVHRCYGLAEVRSWILTSLLALSGVSASGCVRVHAYQRENLAKRAMTNDKTSSEGRFQEHEREAREGSIGSTGQAGGGCGCN
jgi:hypothetical protein